MASLGRALRNAGSPVGQIGQVEPADDDPAHSAWRQPVVWLGVAVLIASLIGCALLIVLGLRYQEPDLSGDGQRLMKVPVTRSMTEAPR